MRVCPRYGATCNAGVCQCANPTTSYAVQTRDGTVCVSGTGATQSCPLPPEFEANPTTQPQGATSLLYPLGGTTAVTCTNNPTGQAFAACQVAGQNGISELYDCIPTQNNAAAHCCPNRALTCIMPLNQGTGTGSFPRWWYNSVTDSCQSFTYRGRAVGGTTFPDGNSNNFGSRESCETYCQNRCERGQPLYSPGTFQPSTTPVTCSSSGGSCSNGNYECQGLGTSAVARCCPTATYVCGLQGGVIGGGPSPQGGYDGDGNAAAVQTITRWYYSEQAQRCLQFAWSQYGGNFNNFETQTQCESFCLNQCTYGTPLKIDGNPNSPNQACPCPSGFTCTSNVCCPNVQRTCNDAIDTGFNSCGGTGFTFVTRYGYDINTRRCRSFTYSGCGGNSNNFQTLSECETACGAVTNIPNCPQGQALNYGTSTSVGGLAYYTCAASSGTQGSCPGNYECINGGCCPTRQYTCSLTFSTGTNCGLQSTRYYYDTTTGRCNTFQYLGCDGNSNNFGTLTTCEEYCGAGGCPNGGTPARDLLNNGFLNCALSTTSCPNNYECSSITTTGVNQQNLCCPSRAYVCSLGSFQGDSNCGTGGNTRYFFDVSVRACRAFLYNGCGGNENNFVSATECNNYCSSAACPAGQRVFSTGTSNTCVVGSTSSCPNGYTCVRDSLFNRNVCCGSSSEGVCSQGESAYIDAGTNQARRCQPGALNSCPTDFFCKLDTVNGPNGQYVCCRPNVFCPSGFLPALQTTFAIGATTSANRPIACYINGFGGFGNFGGSGVTTFCQAGYSCQASVPGSPTGYCCSNTRVCPNGLQVYQDTTGNIPTCNPNFGGNAGCPANYACSTIQATGIGFGSNYCCGLGANAAQYCGTTGQVLVDNGGSPRTCQPATNGFFSQPCPAGYSCTLSATGQYYCCSGVSGVCGTGTPLTRFGQIQLCTRVGDPICGSGYSCTLNANNAQYYCCTGAAGACPAPGVPQTLNGGTVTCNPNFGSGQCGAGYSCSTSNIGSNTIGNTNSNGICCSNIGATVCGVGFSVYQPGGVPIACDVQDNRCQSGQVCKQYVGAGISIAYCCVPDANTNLCPAGVAFSNGAQVQFCSPGQVQGCPNGYFCTLSSQGGQYVCCSSGTIGGSGCPNGQILLSQTCSPQTNSCNGGVCTLISATNRYQCCGGSANNNNQLGLTCPQGGTSTSTVCSSSTQCGVGGSCQFVNGRNVCCSGSTFNTGGSCPQGGVLQAQISCSGPGASCGFGNTCQLISGLGFNQYRCCNGNSATGTGTCPQGGVATSNFCNLGFANTCAGGTCQNIPGVGARCCSTTGVNTGTCPQGGIATSNFCTLGFANTCAGGTCQNIPGIGARCCTTSGGNTGLCPSGQAAIGTCSPSAANSCGFNQLCQLLNGVYRCCPSNRVINNNNCPNGQAPLAFCSPNIANSCGFNQLCQQINGVFRCCQSTGVVNNNNCPSGQAPGSSCTPNIPNVCGVNLACLQVGGQFRCCQAAGTTSGQTCPSGGVTSVPQRFCSPSVGSSCNFGESCQQVAGRFQCCLGGPQTQTVQSQCANGQPAYINPGTRQNQGCVSGNAFGCPNGYACIGSICCQQPVINPNTGCPSAQRRKFSNGNDLGCPLNSNPDPCGAGYSCRAVPEVVGQGVCCRNGFRSRQPAEKSLDESASNSTDTGKKEKKVTRLLSSKCDSSKECKAGAKCNSEKKRCECPLPKVSNGTACITE